MAQGKSMDRTSKSRAPKQDGQVAAPAPPPLDERVDSPAVELHGAGSRIEAVSLLFDPAWYLWRYQDVEQAGVDPVQHYFADGYKEGRNPSRYFDTDWYTAQYPDVLATGTNPFLHYILYGAREGRKPRP